MTFGSLKLWVLDTAERSLSSLVQVAVLFFAANTQGDGMSWWKPLTAAAFPAVGSVLINAIQTLLKIPNPKQYALDVFMRVLRTLLAAIGGGIVADGFDLFNMTSWRTLWIAVGGTLLVFIKGEAAQMLADRRKKLAIYVGDEAKQLTPASLIAPLPPPDPPPLA